MKKNATPKYPEFKSGGASAGKASVGANVGESIIRKCSISNAFAYSLFSVSKERVRLNELLNSEIAKVKAKLGEKKTEHLILKFKNEAYQQKGNNTIYVINKLRTLRNT